MNPQVSKRRAQPWLGTIVEIEVQGDNEDLCTSWINEAFQEIHTVHQQMSFHDENSELTKLNRRAHLEKVECSGTVREVLQFAKDIYSLTNHAVDVTIAPALIKKNFLPSHVDHEACGTPDDIEIESDGVKFKRPVVVDLGGVAKGYAVDRAIEKLQSLGCPSATVNAGGDLRMYGEKVRTLFVRSVSSPTELIYQGDMENVAVATSGGYFSKHEDCVPYVDPESGECLKNIPSVTVMAESCMLADALTKFVILKRPDAQKLNQFRASAWVQT